MKKRLLAVILTCLMLPGAVLAHDAAQGAAQTDTDLETIEGVWRTEGYGMVLTLEDNVVTIYEETAVSCLQTQIAPMLFTGLNAERDGDRLMITDDLTLHITALPLESLPEACANGGTPESADPQLNFEVYWHAFAENYAFFDLYGVDWQAQYAEFRPQVTAETTAEELFAILAAMTQPLDDDHISLQSDFESWGPSGLPAWAGENSLDFMDFMTKTTELIGTRYLDGSVTLDFSQGGYAGDAALVDNPLMFHGQIGDHIGYINLLAMLNDDKSLAESVDAVLAEMPEAEAFIIDLRFNIGGEDGVSLATAGRFADATRPAYHKVTVFGDGYTPERAFSVAPQGPRQFTGPVVVLTSEQTVSAAEIFLMALRTLPHVTVIGEATAGAHSDILDRTLPNGWTFGLSNQVYTLVGGEVYEKVGIPPSIEVLIDPAAVAAGHDNLLDAALAFLDAQ